MIILLSFAFGLGGLHESEPAKAAKRAEKIATTKLPFGIYDPRKRFKRVEQLAYEHVFIDWQDFSIIWLREQVSFATKRGRGLLVTVEPWPDDDDPTKTDESLFGDIQDGRYDDRIAVVCSEISKIDAPVLVRWGHEMEVVTGRYPWAREDSNGYIQAFRYFVTRCRAFAPEAEFIWSPMGHAQLGNYYPGDTYVDFIGLPIYSYQKADRKWYGHDRTFNQAVAEKYKRVKRFKKPVILAELGVSGSRKYEARWLKGMQNVGKRFKRLKAMLYFNMREKDAWPDGLGKPDWRIKPKHLK